MIAILRRCRSHNYTHYPFYGNINPNLNQRNGTGNTIANVTLLRLNSTLSLHDKDVKIKKLPTRIVFGSCSSQNEDLSYWDRIIEQTPDLIILMGDNVYPPPIIPKLDQTIGISTIESAMTLAYQCLGSNPSFMRAVDTRIPIIATLDDNDYNLRHYQYGKSNRNEKMTMDEIDNGLEMTKQEFLRFFQVDSTDERWTKHGRGVYTSYDYYTFENGTSYMRCSTHAVNKIQNDNSRGEKVGIDNNNGQVMWRLQIILLDVRRHKSLFVLQDTVNPNDEKCTGPYIPSYDKQRTMLGACQWKWLEEKLRYDFPLRSSTTKQNDNDPLNHQPNLRIVVSPIQVLSDGRHGWDCWNLFPHERERLLALLFYQSSSAVRTLLNQEQPPKIIPTVLLSGDRHVAGIYKHELHNNTGNNTSKPCVVEVTSSSLTHSVPVGLLDHESDTSRDGNFIYGNNFGVLHINDISKTSNDNSDTKDDAISVSIHCAKTGLQFYRTPINF